MQKEIKSNNQLKTLLFLQLELQGLEKVYSVFSDLLFIFTKYSFLFETSSPEPSSIKPTHTKFETLCSTQDPARDGSNWYGYAGQNPLIHIDPTGLAYYTGPTGASVQSSNTPVTKHEFSETREPSGRPSGTPKAPETPKQTDTALYNDLWDYLWDYGPDLLDFKDGWEKGFKSLGLTLLDNILDISLRKEINGDYEGSLYFQKYINQIQEYKGIDFVFKILSKIPNAEVSTVSTLFGFILDFEKRDGQIVADNIAGFIKGAELEIKRIDYILNNSSDEELIDFVTSEKKKLNIEISYNKTFYFRNYAFSNLNGTLIDVDKTQYINESIPLPGINYLDPTYR